MDKEIKVKDFTMASIGIFQGEKFIECDNDWSGLKDRATKMTWQSGENHTISTIKFEGTDEEPRVKEGTVLFKFSKIKDTVYIIDAFD